VLLQQLYLLLSQRCLVRREALVIKERLDMCLLWERRTSARAPVKIHALVIGHPPEPGFLVLFAHTGQCATL